MVSEGGARGGYAKGAGNREAALSNRRKLHAFKLTTKITTANAWQTSTVQVLILAWIEPPLPLILARIEPPLPLILARIEPSLPLILAKIEPPLPLNLAEVKPHLSLILRNFPFLTVKLLEETLIFCWCKMLKV